MRRARLMILLLVVILVSPNLLFAEDWTSGITSWAGGAASTLSSGYNTMTSGINGMLDASYNAGYNTMGALRTGYNTYIAPTSIGSNLQAISTGLQNFDYRTLSAGTVKFPTMPYSTFKAGVSFGSDLASTAKAGVSFGSDLVSTAASRIQTISFGDYIKNSDVYKQGYDVMGRVTNFSVQRTQSVQDSIK